MNDVSNWFCIIQIRKENLTDPFIWENLLGWRVYFIVLLLPSKLSEDGVTKFEPIRRSILDSLFH